MEEEKQILYCFKFDDDTGEIQRIVIDDYAIRKVNNFGKVVYSFRVNELSNGTRVSVVNDKLDRFVSHKIYTFTDDMDRARKIINDTLKKNIAEYQQYLSRQVYMLNKLNVKTEAECE